MNSTSQVDKRSTLSDELVSAVTALAPEEQQIVLDLVHRTTDPERGQRLFTVSNVLRALLQGKFLFPLETRNPGARYSTFFPPDVLPSNGSLERISLPFEPALLARPVGDTMNLRSSERYFSPNPLSIEELGTLLHASYGLRKRTRAYNTKDFPLRYAPSAGGLQAVELYVAVNNIAGLRQGIHHYHAPDNTLELETAGLVARKLVQICFGEEWVGHAAAVIILICDVDKLEWKYGPRCFFMAHVDVGIVAENLHLVATSMNLASCMMAGFQSSTLDDLLALKLDTQYPVLLLPFGKKTQLSARRASRETRAAVNPEL